MKVYLNNKFINGNDASINIKDRGLLLGDGIFDTLLYNNHKIILFDYHFERFKKSISNCYFNFKISKKNLKEIILKLVRINNLQNYRVSIRCSLTRGIAKKRGLDFELSHQVNFFITTTILSKESNLNPIKISVSSIKRYSNSMLVKNKTNNYFENVQAKYISQKKGFDDVLILNEKNNFCCCSSSNIFYVIGNKLFTPSLKEGALDGTVRRYLIEKKKVAVKSISLNNLKDVSEIFLTNSIGLRSVSKVNNVSFKSGPITEKTKEFLNKLGI